MELEIDPPVALLEHSLVVPGADMGSWAKSRGGKTPVGWPGTVRTGSIFRPITLSGVS